MNDDVFRKSEPVIARRILGRTLLVPVHGHVAQLQRLFELNETGEHLWGRIDGSRPAGELAADLAAHFDTPLEQALADVRAFLAALRERGLVEAVP
jgi:hypothetical protein